MSTSLDSPVMHGIAGRINALCGQAVAAARLDQWERLARINGLLVAQLERVAALERRESRPLPQKG